MTIELVGDKEGDVLVSFEVLDRNVYRDGSPVFYRGRAKKEDAHWILLALLAPQGVVEMRLADSTTTRCYPMRRIESIQFQEGGYPRTVNDSVPVSILSWRILMHGVPDALKPELDDTDPDRISSKGRT